jgi:xylose dehydrogenase (NAD/NADP)
LTVRIGILSTAAINDELLPGFAAVAEAELVAVASRSRAKAEDYARSRGIPCAFGSYEDMLADADVDAVYISLPNGLHREWVDRALRAEKHVLCEKPLTAHADEARELFDLAKARGRVLMEAFMYRHHPIAVKVSELVGSGAVGASSLCARASHSPCRIRVSTYGCGPTWPAARSETSVAIASTSPAW